jgi:hypothetical protein
VILIKNIETDLSNLANQNPKELSRLLTSPNTNIKILSVGVEILGGEVGDETLTLPVFKKLLKHINAVVREAAMIGVSAFYTNKTPPFEIIQQLQFMLEEDPSPNIKNYAAALLEDFDKPQIIYSQSNQLTE